MKTDRKGMLLRTIRGAVAAAVSLAATPALTAALPPVATDVTWQTVLNNNDPMPGAPGGRTFNSYNQPSVNVNGVVVIRARSRGGPPLGPATHGIYTRDMGGGGNVVRLLDRSTPVPDPNNLGSTFVETPSIPRIGINSTNIATRGNHQPVWQYTLNGTETRAGTTGIYVDLGNGPFTGAAKLGAVPGFEIFAVPGAAPGTFFDVFPGSPAITDENITAFKGNYTEGGEAKTGVFYRELTGDALGGAAPVQWIANSDTEIPGLPPGIRKKFGSFDSTSPPSAADGKAVFVGLDNEATPSYGGIYQAPLSQPPKRLTLLIGIGSRVPGQTGPSFSLLGEGLSYDGRFVAFWGAWGNATKTVRLYCPTEGNAARRAYCNSAASGSTQDQAGNWYQDKAVPINQGIFVYDSQTRRTRMVARTNRDFDDLTYWNFSGRSPGVGEGEEGEDDGEPARWRSSAFIAVSGTSVAFKARTGNIDRATHVYVNPVDGIYLQRSGGAPLETLVDTTMEGRTAVNDAEAPAGVAITELGIERDGFRGNNLVINARMGVEGGTEEEDGWAGIYLANP